MGTQTVNVGFEQFFSDGIKEKIDSEMKWTEDRILKCAESVEEVRDFIDKAILKGKCAVDLETTGLNTRVRKNKPIEKIVGIGLCYDKMSAIYIPLNHQIGSNYNLDEKLVLEEMKRLCKSCITVYHNAKFDLSFLKNYGVTVPDYRSIEDTYVLAHIYDAGMKGHDLNLKILSKNILNHTMIEFKEITKNFKRFDLVSPKIGYQYAAVDPLCTLELEEFFKLQNIVIEQEKTYNLEKRLIFVVMEMESNYVKIDVPYLKQVQMYIETYIKDIEKQIHALAKKEFNIGSSQQLGKILFDELGYKYPEKEKTASGQYSTSNETLEKIADSYPIVKKIIDFRTLEKINSTYVINLLNNHDEDDCIKLGFNQCGTDTGRFSSPGGSGINEDGYSGMNVQSTPKEPDENFPEIDIRKSVVARPGKTIVAADYENEEMRIATNLSKETVWIDAVNKGIDFHTATAAVIHGKTPENVTKAERKLGKTCNFLALYLGGPFSLSIKAKIALSEAKKILASYFIGVPKLKRWMDLEIVKAKKLKYVKTVFGRYRPLEKFFNSGDKATEAHGERCAVNHNVQGTAADFIKIVMSRIYNWIHTYNLQDDVKMLITMHDELVFEVTTEKLELYVTEIAKIMMLSDVVNDQLKWALPLTLDIKYGNSWRAEKKFFKDFPQTKELLTQPVLDLSKLEGRPKAEQELTEKQPVVDHTVEQIPVQPEPDSKKKEELPPVKENQEQIAPNLNDPTNKFYSYTVKNLTRSNLRWLNSILLFLKEEIKTNKIYKGDKKILRLKDPQGQLLLVEEPEIFPESFITLTRFFGL